LAPSPTGALHLGNFRTFLVNALLARQRGWRIIMRIEDLDGPRVKPESCRQTIDLMHWLGLSWDGDIVYQSDRHSVYEQVLRQLVQTGMAYPCTCSRKDIELAAGAPHREDGLTAYPGTCRKRFATSREAEESAGRPPAWRVVVPDEPISFDDAFAGSQQFNLAREGGDFVIFRKQGLAAYQLAVVVDDAHADVDVIVRGDDLLDSAARQIYLRRLLDLTPEPTYWHLPLVIGEDGRRLAKRHGDTRLVTYRSQGASPQRVLGLLGMWCGLLDSRREATFDELLKQFDLDRLPREPVVFTAEDDAFLRGR
jgi:glutamyl-tRNA synthetase